MNSNDREIQERIATILLLAEEQDLPASEQQWLVSQLLDSPQAMTLYLRHIELLSGVFYAARDVGTSVAMKPTNNFPSNQPNLKGSLKPRSPMLGFLGRPATILNRGVVWSVLAVAIVYYGTFTAISWNLWSVPHPPQNTVQLLPAATEPIVKLVRTDHCQWEADLTPALLDQPFSPRQIKLLSGIAELLFVDGARVVVEGPADISLETANRSYLHRGKLVATVPQHAIGFTVETPTAKIVDLGTEFGVEVGKSGTTDVQVSKGKVELRPRLQTSGAPASSAITVKAGTARRIEANTAGEITVREIATEPGRVQHDSPRQRSVSIDLVDIVAGGDGRYHSRGRGIDLTNGQVLFLPNEDYAPFNKREGSGYQRVDGLPLIDGVNIPDSSKGPVQLTSVQHTFDGFPKNNGDCWGPIWAGGSVPQPPKGPTIGTSFDDKIDYAKVPHGLIAMVPNKLITFDLDAIRREYPNRSLSLFRSVVGVTKHGDVADGGLADTWVFVDGNVRHNRLTINATHGPQLVEIPVTKSMRFLTLAATDGGNGFYSDCVIFADPQIEFEVNESQPRQLRVPATK